MTADQFWGIIEQSRVGLSLVTTYDEMAELQTEQLHSALMPLSPEEIQAFDEHYGNFHGEAYRWDLWGVAFLINGFVSDDGFDYFRCWLIAQGKDIYTNTLRAPDTLADALPPKWDYNAEFEDIWHVADHVYLEKTGVDLADAPPLPHSNDYVTGDGTREIKGERWE